MTDNLQNLLIKKQSFEAQYEEIIGLTHKIKQQNDALQRNLDMEMDQEHINLLTISKEQSKKSFDTMNQIISQLEKNSKGFEQKKQIKLAKQFLVKESERNKQLLRDLLKKQVIQSNNIDEDEQQYKISQNQVDPQYQQEYKQNYYADVSHQIISQNQEDINHIEHQTITLNKIVNELGFKIDEQDSQLDIITHDLLKTKNNVELANQEVTEANQIQMERKKKYYGLLLFIVMLLTAVFTAFIYII